MGGVQTLIFLSQSGNDEVKVSCVVAFENFIKLFSLVLVQNICSNLKLN